MSPQELLAGGWHNNSLALVMPGGADLPYCRKLNGKGNCIIRGVLDQQSLAHWLPYSASVQSFHQGLQITQGQR